MHSSEKNDSHKTFLDLILFRFLTCVQQSANFEHMKTHMKNTSQSSASIYLTPFVDNDSYVERV